MDKTFKPSKDVNVDDCDRGRCSSPPLLSSLSAQNDLIPTFVADQTPTPTRFLRTCEDAGLFSLISELPGERNPFDDAFHQAALCEEQQRQEDEHLAAPEVLDVDHEIRNYSESNSDDSGEVCVKSDKLYLSVEHKVSMQQSKRSVMDGQLVVHSPGSTDQQFVTVLLKLADGSLTPINLPVEALKQATPTAAGAAPQPGISQTLDSTLRLIPLPVTGNTGSHHFTAQADVQNEVVHPHSAFSVMIQTDELKSSRSGRYSDLLGTDDVRMLQENGGNLTHKRSHPTLEIHRAATDVYSNSCTSDDVGDVRKKQALESNRAAASRSRNKRKAWINNLESKTTDLQRINKQLTIETNKLKDEILMLKRALDEHQDCSPTYPNYKSHQSSR